MTGNEKLDDKEISGPKKRKNDLSFIYLIYDKQIKQNSLVLMINVRIHFN